MTRNYYCSFCGTLFRTKVEFDKHCQDNHRDRLVEAGEQPGSSRQVVACGVEEALNSANFENRAGECVSLGGGNGDNVVGILNELTEEDLEIIDDILAQDFVNPEDIEDWGDEDRNFRERLCPICIVRFRDPGDLDMHRFVHHSDIFPTEMQPPVQVGGALNVNPFELIQGQAGRDGIVREYELDLTDGVFANVAGVFSVYREHLTSLLRQIHSEIGAFRIIATLIGEMSRICRIQESEVEIENFPFNSFMHSILDPTMISTGIKHLHQKMALSLETFLRGGSGWNLKRFLNLHLRILQFRMDKVTSYISTPKRIRSKRCIVNIKNDDEMCFKYCILAGINPIYQNVNVRWEVFTDPRTYQRMENDIFWDCIQFPMTMCQLDKFLHFNPNLAVNVFGYEEIDELDPSFEKKKLHVFPLFICRERRAINIDLLLLLDGANAHFTLLKQSDENPSEGLSKLLGREERTAEKFICRFCLLFWKTKATLDKHTEYCAALDLQRLSLQNERFYTFKRVAKTLPVPFIIYLDFEAILVPQQHSMSTRRLGKVYNEHVACGWAYIIIGPLGYPMEPMKVYNGEDSEHKLLDSLIETCSIYFPQLSLDVGLDNRWSRTDLQNLRSMSSHCIHCGLETPSALKVVDHCHYTGTVRGISCNKCNLAARTINFIPVVCHGFRNYDSKFIVQAFRSTKLKSVQVLPLSTEKLTSIVLTTLDNHVLKFIDSYQFMSSSLAAQVKGLAKDDLKHFAITRLHFASHTDSIDLLFQKASYPYSYFDSFSKFDETKLPPAEAWTNDLTGETISQEELDRAQRIWDVFGCNTLRDFHNFYVSLDTLLLADCFQNFRRKFLQDFRLDPAHYITLPGIAFDAAMLSGGVQFEYLSELEMYTLFERGIRGGICSVGLRYARANNKYMGTSYDPSQPTSYLCFWDANLLYSSCLGNYVPWKYFRWDKTLINRTTRLHLVAAAILGMADDCDIGMILEVDLDYPKELHDAHNDYPLAVEKKTICYEDLSGHTRKVMVNVGATVQSCRKTKLLGTLENKKNYVVHYRLLKLFLQLGLKLTKVHCALKFKQGPLLKVYIDFCIQHRRDATSDLDRQFYKGLGNIVVGKTYQNVRKYQRINVAVTKEKIVEYGKKPTVQDIKIIHDNCIMFIMKKLVVRLDKPIFIGQAICDDSKRVMYDFYYNFLKPKYGSNMRLVMTDTDSFLLHIKTEDVYMDMHESVNGGVGRFDTSNFDPTNPFVGYVHSNEHEGKAGYFKDECANCIISEVVALKPKLYSVKLIRPDGSEGQIKKAKGTKRSVVNKELHFEDYLRVLNEGSSMCTSMNTIRSLNHRLYTSTLTKRSLSAVEDKSFYLSPTESLRFGHYRIQEYDEDADNLEQNENV